MFERFESFTYLISKIHRCIRKIKTEEMSEFNLKSTHVSCLYFLYNEKSLTAKELCDLCGEDKGLMSRTIDFLENNGFVICNSKTAKKYKSPIELTEKGRQVGESITIKIKKILDLASEGLSDDNRVILYESLNLISNNLERICYKENKNVD